MTKLDKELLEIITKEFETRMFSFKTLCTALTKHRSKDDEWVHTSEIHAVLSSLVKQNKIEFIDPKYKLVAMTMNIKDTIKSHIISALTIKRPTLKNTPNYLTKKAIAIWPEFFKKYGNLVRREKDTEKSWAVAVAIFRNYCTKRNIPIFTDEASLDTETKDYMENRINSMRLKVINRFRIVLKDMKSKGFAKKVLKEKVNPVGYSGAKYIISTYVNIDLVDTFNNNVKSFLKNKGFLQKPGKFVYSIGNTTITIMPDSKSPSRLLAINEMVFTPQHIKLALNIDEETLKDKVKVARLLSNFIKNKLKEDCITNEMLGVTMPIDFSLQLDDKEKEALENIKNNLPSECNNLVAEYNISIIRTLGSPVYQYNLIKLLALTYPGCSSEWDNAVKDPNSYLNPDIYNKIEDNIETNDEF